MKESADWKNNDSPNLRETTLPSAWNAKVDLTGTTFQKRFFVEEILGAGGAGQVYRCRDLAMQRIVALKILSGQLEEKTVRRFQTEAIAISRVEHPGLVKVYEFGLSEESSPYLIMEFIEGKSLSDILRQEVTMSPEASVELFLPLFDALQAMHDKGVIHRDLKPANIMVSDSAAGRSARIVDFGIAKLLTESNAGLTQTGEIFGSPLYMSPEQACGIRVDARTDQYSLGCLIFECLTGTPPHVGKTSIDTLLKHQSEKAPTLREASMGTKFYTKLEDAVARLLAKQPEQRFDSMRQAQLAFQNCLENEVVNQPAGQLDRNHKKSYVLMAISVTLIASLAIVLNGFFTAKPTAAPRPSHTTETGTAENLVTAHSKPSANSHNDAPNISDASGGMLEATGLAANNSAFIEFLRNHSSAIEIHIDPDMPDERLVKQSQPTFNKAINNSAMKGFDNLYRVQRLSMLNCSSISEKGMLHVMHLPLRDANLTGTPVTDNSVESLLKILSLEKLGLESTKVTSEAFKKPHEKLSSLTLNSTSVDDKCLGYLKRYPKLRSLSLANTKISNEGMKALRDLPLNGLWISGTGINDGAADAIATMKTLTYLSVSETAVTDKFLSKLSNMQNLKQVRIENCAGVTPAGAKRFKEAHPGCEVFDKPIFNFKNIVRDD